MMTLNPREVRSKAGLIDSGKARLDFLFVLFFVFVCLFVLCVRGFWRGGREGRSVVWKGGGGVVLKKKKGMLISRLARAIAGSSVA